MPAFKGKTSIVAGGYAHHYFPAQSWILLHTDFMPRILYFFALCNLVIGSGAFVLSGILQPLARELGISIAAAGQVMTAYAVATALLAPILILLTATWPRKRAIQLALGLFTAGNLVSALAPSLGVLLLGRVLMGAGAMFTAAVSAYAVT